MFVTGFLKICWFQMLEDICVHTCVYTGVCVCVHTHTHTQYGDPITLLYFVHTHTHTQYGDPITLLYLRKQNIAVAMKSWFLQWKCDDFSESNLLRAVNKRSNKKKIIICKNNTYVLKLFLNMVTARIE
jgi:hypothetical protein